jgi:hypothetical protein
MPRGPSANAREARGGAHPAPRSPAPRGARPVSSAGDVRRRGVSGTLSDRGRAAATTVTLDLARIAHQTALPAAPGREDGGAVAAAYAEKVTLTGEARAASHRAGPVPRGTVRWYRAARVARSTSAAAPGARSLQTRAMHAGVAAYRRALASAAAP